MYVCISVTLVHPATAVRRNEMPFGVDICVDPSNIVLDGGPDPPTGRGDLGVGTPNRRDQTPRTVSTFTNIR